jgi:hypothetical protein
VNLANSAVAAVLRSPLHRLLSRSTALIRFTGRRSGREFVTPVQYVRDGEQIVILVGRPATKSWWRNFFAERDIDVLLERHWVHMSGHAIVGADDPDAIEPLLDAYLTRFPRAVRMFSGGSRAAQAVIVRCRPR